MHWWRSWRPNEFWAVPPVPRESRSQRHKWRGLPLGLAIMERWSATPVFVLGALIPALALVAIAGLPKIFAQPTGGESVRLSVFAVLVPVLALACVSASFGGLSSLLPIAISERAAVAGVVLATASGSMLVGRYSAGLIADRLGSGRTLAPALASSTIGLVLFAINVDGGSTPVLFCAAVLFGLGGSGGGAERILGHGVSAAGPRQLGSASAIWNIGYDAGTGIGALALGFVATTAGYAWVFAVSAVVVALLPALAAGGKVIGSRVAR